MTLDDVRRFLDGATDSDRRAVLRLLREDYGLALHRLETNWNTTAEAILEAIAQAGDLTQRGIRGVLAEATFRTVVVPKQLLGWTERPVHNDEPYDLLLNNGGGDVRVQVKLQRRQAGEPLLHKKTVGVFVVETQRTRGGTRKGSKEPSRPYRVDEFDVLAVCLQPSTGNWQAFIYSAAGDLQVRKDNPQLLEVLQPIQMTGSETWSLDFEHAVARAKLR